MQVLVDEETIDKLDEFFTRSMSKMNVGKSYLDAQAIANWNECAIAVGRLSAQLKMTRDNAQK